MMPDLERFSDQFDRMTIEELKELVRKLRESNGINTPTQ
jgi:hypothetical protein